MKVKVLLILHLFPFFHLFPIKTLEGRSKLPTETTSDFDTRGAEKKFSFDFFFCKQHTKGVIMCSTMKYVFHEL